ncbi:MAG: T9SS type A sorting domain-containing protein [Bacteroidota bacterium]|nr:T9SS type A sorting domain-containing protein [Bacteroidota bacterium]
MKKVSIVVFFLLSNFVYFAQISPSGCTLNGGMSLGSLCANGCLAGCDLTAYNYFGTPQCNGTGISGSCSSQIKSTTFTLPAGCVATGTAEFKVRGVCTASGADAGDNLTVTGTGGTSTGLPYNVTGASNANLISNFTKTGGSLTIQLTADRRDEIVTWTITLSGSCGTNCNLVLPITLTDFYAKPTESSIELNWHVASEENVNYYIVERSTDGINFELLNSVGSLAPVAGKNNLDYSSTDFAPKNGINYYRLANVDKDGSVNYAKTIMVNFNQTHTSDVWVNQTETEIIISYENSFLNKTFYLMDMNGKKIGEYRNLNNDLNYFTIDKLSLPKGLYVIGCSEGNMPPQKILIN